jgi:hypothetical protein
MAGDALALGLSDPHGWSGSTYRLGANRVGRNMCNATQDDDRFGDGCCPQRWIDR